VFFVDVAQQVLFAQQSDWHAFSLGALERMHDRAETLIGVAMSAAATTDIIIRFNIGYVIAQDTPHVDLFNKSSRRLTLPALISSVQDHASHGVIIGVAEGDECGRYAAFPGQFLRGAGKDKKWFSTWFFADVDVTPAHRFADAGAECFGYRFLSGEARGQMSRRKFHRHGIFDFLVGENAMKKAFAETIERMLYAGDFDKINADAEHTHLERESSATLLRFVSGSVRAALAFSEVAIHLGKLDRFKRPS
jgi:hypothetical protein